MHPHHHYNGTDVLATRQVLDTLLPLAHRRGVGDLARAELVLEAPLMAIARRGVLLDAKAVREEKDRLEEAVSSSIAEAERLAGRSLSGPKSFSTTKLARFFFVECRLRGSRTTKEVALRQILNKRRGTSFPSKRDAQRVRELASEIARLVLQARHAGKLLGVLRAKKHHGRLRGSFNVGATETHRLSSSSTPMRDGTNLQNIANPLRHLFIPSSPDWVFIGMDQERAESHVVAQLSGDEAYIRAHAEGDTHLNVAALAWPERGTAEELHARYEAGDSEVKGLRQRSKATQHAMNYLEPEASSHTVARLLSIPVAQAAEVMERYYGAFPGITEEKHRLAEEIQRTGAVTVGGIRRHLHGKLSDPRTLREALSHRPQLLSTWTTNIVLMRLWLELDRPEALRVLVHTHDGILLEVRRDLVEELRPAVEARTSVPWPLDSGRELDIPWEIKVGENWEEVC